MSVLTSSYTKYLEAIEKFIANASLESYPSNLSEPTAYIMNIKGKRLRPLMTILAAKTFGVAIQDSVSAGVAMEMFHNSTLVHDDIMDEAPLRRGKDAVHVKYGNNKAIVVGDAMMMKTISLLIQDHPDKASELTNCFCKMALEVMEGQQMDMEFETRGSVSEEEYLKMIAYKTSVLFAACLQVGAIIGDASKEDQELLYDYGLKIGLSFQIMDDYLDTYGDHNFGKRIGGDIVQNKKTFLMINAIKNCSPDQLSHLNKLFSETNEEKKISELTELYNELNIPEITQQKMNAFYEEAIESLMSTSLSFEQKEQFKDLANSILKRNK